MNSKRKLLIIVVAILYTLLMVILIINFNRHLPLLLAVYALSLCSLWLLWTKGDSLPTMIRTDFLLAFKKPIVINATVYFRYGKMEHYNWGDDMNYHLLSEVLHLPIVLYSYSFLRESLPRIGAHNYLVIGSTITMLTNPNTIIWGAGVVDNKEPLPCKPKKVLAVRGPKTRAYLLSKGVDCPEVFGDPILLLKYLYYPKITKKYQIGIIPHYKDYDDAKWATLKQDPRVQFIKMQNYNNWRDVVDQVLSCDFIVSSSLHGLILAETYSIPSLWIQVSDKIRGGEFKYLDFYESIHVSKATPYTIREGVTVEELWRMRKQYHSGYINLLPLIKSAPTEMRLEASIKIE